MNFVSSSHTTASLSTTRVSGSLRASSSPSRGSGYDGVHWNSTILSHAFYLAIEGGQNRSTGLTVQGVAPANRHQVERAFFRSMTHLMPARTSFRMTAAVIRQSAVDLFGAGSATHRAIDQALNAVGLR